MVEMYSPRDFWSGCTSDFTFKSGVLPLNNLGLAEVLLELWHNGSYKIKIENDKKSTGL